MTESFDTDYHSPARPTETPVSVLYVDRDETAMDAVVQYAERERPRVRLWGTTDPSRAIEALSSREWACLVVGDGFEAPDRRNLLAKASCPAVLFGTATDQQGPDEPTPAAEAPAEVAVVVEKVLGEGGISSLFDEVVANADVFPDGPDGPGENPADALVRDVVRELGLVTDRDTLEQAVCEQLLQIDHVTLACLGTCDDATGRLIRRTTVGEPRQYLREGGAATPTDGNGDSLVREVTHSREFVVVDDIRAAEPVQRWHNLALAYDVYSLVMVPLTHGEAVHGVLCLYATEPGVFDDRLVECLSLLGDTIGFAMTAVQNRRLLRHDSTVELEFRSGGTDAFLGRLASAMDCRIEMEGEVGVGTDVLQYLAVSSADVAQLAETAAGSDGISDARVVRAEDGGGVVEIRTPTALERQLSDAGARLRQAVVSPSETTIVVEAPVDSDVRMIREAVRRYCPGAELVTKTGSGHVPIPAVDRESADERLTDRQREVLRAAYLAGYYAWPRDTTAEELAESLDIASPTLHQHLRRAERNILTSLFD